MWIIKYRNRGGLLKVTIYADYRLSQSTGLFNVPIQGINQCGIHLDYRSIAIHLDYAI